MNKAVPAPQGALSPDLGSDPDLNSLSKRMTQHAAARLMDLPNEPGQTGMSPAAEAEHIGALRRYITSKEAVVARFRNQLDRFPADIATLRDRMATETDSHSKLIISKNLEAYNAMKETLEERIKSFDASWPARKAEMQAAIDAYDARMEHAHWGDAPEN